MLVLAGKPKKSTCALFAMLPWKLGCAIKRCCSAGTEHQNRKMQNWPIMFLCVCLSNSIDMSGKVRSRFEIYIKRKMKTLTICHVGTFMNSLFYYLYNPNQQLDSFSGKY